VTSGQRQHSEGSLKGSSTREVWCAGGSVLAGLGILFFVRVTGVIVNALISQTPVAAAELALHVSDFMITPAWVIGRVLLWRREPLGYVTGLGLLFQASMLFIGLIFVLILRPFITAAQFVPSELLVIFVMGSLLHSLRPLRAWRSVEA
jgi:uncharacterized membrane protein